MKRGKSREPAPDPIAEFNALRAALAAGAAGVGDALLEAGAAKIDALFGAGYAAAHPELLGRYLEVTGRIFENDFATATDFDGDFEDESDLGLDDLFGEGRFGDDPADRGRRRR
jgi:hypothetical protein